MINFVLKQSNFRFQMGVEIWRQLFSNSNITGIISINKLCLGEGQEQYQYLVKLT